MCVPWTIAQPPPPVVNGISTPATARTHVENQISHWMFAMWETLATNTVRALAAILAQTEQVDTRIPVPKVDWLAVGPEVALIGAALVLVMIAAINRGVAGM